MTKGPWAAATSYESLDDLPEWTFREHVACGFSVRAAIPRDGARFTPAAAPAPPLAPVEAVPALVVAPPRVTRQQGYGVARWSPVRYQAPAPRVPRVVTLVGSGGRECS